jgi:hypothetical protein
VGFPDRIERADEPTMFACTWHAHSLSPDDPRRTHVEFTLHPTSEGTRLSVIESGFAQFPGDAHEVAVSGNTKGRRRETR